MKQVSITRSGETFTGTYTVTKDILKVMYDGKSKSTQLGNMNPEVLAEQLLSEILKS